MEICRVEKENANANEKKKMIQQQQLNRTEPNAIKWKLKKCRRRE